MYISQGDAATTFVPDHVENSTLGPVTVDQYGRTPSDVTYCGTYGTNVLYMNGVCEGAGGQQFTPVVPQQLLPQVQAQLTAEGVNASIANQIVSQDVISSQGIPWLLYVGAALVLILVNAQLSKKKGAEPAAPAKTES